MRIKSRSSALYLFVLAAALLIMAVANAAFAASDSAPSITITGTYVSGSEATVTWTTSEPSNATFAAEGEVNYYSWNTNFSAQFGGFAPGKHAYVIVACNKGSKCALYDNTFSISAPEAAESSASTTAVSEPVVRHAPLTGAAVAGLKKVQSSMSGIIFLLLAVVALFIVAGGILQKLDDSSFTPSSMRMSVALNKAESAIMENSHHDAYPLYQKMRYLYEGMNARDKGRYQSRVLNVYSELLSHARAKEANHLADKYLAGTISNEELMRLKELMES